LGELTSVSHQYAITSFISTKSTYKGKFQEPGNEEGQKLLRSDSCTCGEAVLKILPSTSKDAAKQHREYVASVERLDSIPDDANDSSNEDEEVRSVHSHSGACEHRADFSQHGVIVRLKVNLQANVVFHTWTCHEKNHHCCKERTNHSRHKRLLPSLRDVSIRDTYVA
jgi:hypothetical protein